MASTNYALVKALERRASLDEIRSIVTAKPNAVKAEDKCGYVPLHSACLHDASLNVVQYLVEQYPDSIHVKNDYYLYRACIGKENESLDAVQKLDYANFGTLPIHLACHGIAPLDVVQFLVKKKPDSIKDKTNNGKLPLHYAVAADSIYMSSLAIVQFLVGTYPGAIEEPDHHGETPLALACDHDEIKFWMESYLKIRWVRIGDYILLRALVDQSRASLEMGHSLVVGKKRKFETISEWDLMDFVFLTSPDGVFAVIMCYL